MHELSWLADTNCLIGGPMPDDFVPYKITQITFEGKTIINLCLEETI